MYRVLIENKAAKVIQSLPATIRPRVVEALEKLAENPRPAQCKKLIGVEGWRVRIGDYRILYTIDDQNNSLAIYRVGHGKGVYR